MLDLIKGTNRFKFRSILSNELFNETAGSAFSFTLTIIITLAIVCLGVHILIDTGIYCVFSARVY